jgi:hypothetical protein
VKDSSAKNALRLPAQRTMQRSVTENPERLVSKSGDTPPTALIHIDLDGLWAVRQCYGQPIDDTFNHDPVYTEALPQFLDLLDEFNMPATFFVVGKDATVAEKGDFLRLVHQRGHEIANHGFSHVLGLSALSQEEIADEIIKTQGVIHELTGGYPVGFRSPGYDVTERILNLLRDLEFRYDSSLFPTPFGFVFRAADRYLSARLRSGKRQFGQARYAFAPLTPYFPHPDNLLEKMTPQQFAREDRHIVEIPVSVSPTLRLPMHCGVALMFGLGYFKRCAEHVRRKRMPLVCLFHGVDLVDTVRHPVFPGRRRGSSFFPSSYEKKKYVVREILQFLASHFRPTLTRTLVEHISELTAATPSG